MAIPNQPADARIETSIMIGAPIAAVWSILTDYASYDAWNPYVIKIVGEATAGTIIEVHSLPAVGGEVMVAPVAVISVEPYVMRWEGGLPDRTKFKGDHWFSLVSVEEHITQLLHHEFFTGALTASLMDAYRGTIEANFVRFNEALKQRTEAET
jgi:hypothetical protein